MSEPDQDRLRRYLRRIMPGPAGMEDLPRQVAAATESLPAAGPFRTEAAFAEAGAPERPPAMPDGAKLIPDATLAEAACRAAEKLRDGKTPLSPEERFATEAIIIPEKRPAFDIIGGDFTANHRLWGKLKTDPAIHRRLRSAIPCVGRIELPGQSRIPYCGTGFVVGRGLLMTNRHVADIFALGVGERGIRFRTGTAAGVDFKRERGQPSGAILKVRSVRMIHPWWDMALLDVEGLPDDAGLLRLSTRDARDMAGREVAVIGYPAYDPLGNDPAVQNRLFDRTYGVKRLQPGEVAASAKAASFGKIVDAATHDCSTLMGNSGSMVMDLATGEVVALHFGGRYLDVNVAVPAAELARDGRVRDAGVAIAGDAPSDLAPDWLNAWNDTEASMQNETRPSGPPRKPDGATTIEIPVRITVTIGDAVRMAPDASAPAPLRAERSAGDGQGMQEALREPDHDTDYTGRWGYSPFFLTGREVPLPKARDPRALATLKEGGTELTYQNFSILMHAERRLALVTAANVTREKPLREPEPGRSYTRKDLGGLGTNDRETWFPDPRLDAVHQLTDAFYSCDGGAFDKGHIVRREDVAWGRTYGELKRANGDTFHITNCSPQVAQFNQSSRGEDNWGDLENLVQVQSASERYCVFAGPILEAGDGKFPGRGGQPPVPIPSRYWKVVVASTEDGLAAYGFVLEQDLSRTELEFVVPENFRRLMAPLAAIEEAAGVDFGEILRGSDRYASDAAEEIATRGGLARTRSLARTGEDRTPHAGDDAEAVPGVDRTAPLTEAPVSWRVAKSLLTLRGQVNRRAPGRNRASDGTIGDPSHANRNSDHNPWVTDGAMGVVTAMDITHDPRGGCDAGALAASVVASKDSRVKYVIWDRRIANSSAVGGQPPWAWRPYTGSNPHNKHVHLSVRSEKAVYDDETAWDISGPGVG
ncbi:DNA/RNA non-specific endonuclease [Azospirillum sp. A26]|uniref:DNA/RNA non-specific endonuclease n=1 Tax=Azospirillum sp. A26 TaxID=3160607 RepID=UPI00366B8236